MRLRLEVEVARRTVAPQLHGSTFRRRRRERSRRPSSAVARGVARSGDGSSGASACARSSAAAIFARECFDLRAQLARGGGPVLRLPDRSREPFFSAFVRSAAVNAERYSSS